MSDNRLCQLCEDDISERHHTTKFCGKEIKMVCKTCGKSFNGKCSNRQKQYCDKKCQSNDPTSIASANEKRIALGYLSDAALKSQIAVKEKYGVENISQIEDVKKKKALRGPTGFARPEFKERIRELYGVDNVSQLPEFKQKKKETALLKYGVDNVSKAPEIIEKIKTTNMNNFGVSSVLCLPENQLKSTKNNKYRISKLNKRWKKNLDDRFNVEFSLEVLMSKNIKNTSMADLGYQNLLVDINPTISHNSTFAFPHLTGSCKKENCVKHTPRDSNYHQERALLARENSFVLMQFFDWFNEEIFISMIEAKLHLSKNRTYARKCDIKEISQKEANKFLKENHLLGGSTGQTYCLGLFHNNELVHVQTYGKSRLNKNYEWEAIRSCSKLHYHVIGGFSRCDKKFFEENNPSSVISYVDLATSPRGPESTMDGWKLSHISKPTATWVNLYPSENKKTFIKDSTARRISADRLLGFEVGDNYPRFNEDGSKITNDDVLILEGFVKVYNCGNLVYVWKKD